MVLKDLKKFNLPDAPGVYFFRNKEGILYVGKATSLKDRVKSYFARDLMLTRGPKIHKMLAQASSVDFRPTDSVLEALILEANEIRRLQPIYNSREKDDKSYNFVSITKEEFPRVIVTRGSGDYGPYPHSRELREALKIIRKIFPYRDMKCLITPKLKPCFNAQIGLCPGPCAGRISKTEYRKQIRQIKLFLSGKKETLIKLLEKEMQGYAKEHEFEKAEIVKRKLFALDHIQDIALIKADFGRVNYDSISSPSVRVEAYDIAHMSGREVVGVMTVVCDGEVDKSQYRKFKIRADKNDDVNNLKEVLSRRLNHHEWSLPQLIVVDGGVAQLHAGENVVRERGLSIPVVAVTKDEHHKAKQIIAPPNFLNPDSERAILLANAEAHRFAIGYHRKLRGKGFRI